MASAALTGQDTIKINQRVLVDFGDGEVGNLTFPNDLVAVKTGKNGNSLYGFNETGRQCELALRVIRGSSDDKFLNNLVQQIKNNFPGFTLLTGEFTKSIGDGSGRVIADTYVMSGGVPTKEVEALSNTDGNTDQSISVYHFRFTNSPRTIG